MTDRFARTVVIQGNAGTNRYRLPLKNGAQHVGQVASKGFGERRMCSLIQDSQIRWPSRVKDLWSENRAWRIPAAA
jgi:hypothetical protein